MNFEINAAITSQAAAKMLISGEMDLSNDWAPYVAEKVIRALLGLSVAEIFHIVDSNSYGDIADVKHIPQFGLIETLKKVPCYFVQKGVSIADYAQMGFFLKNDITAKLSANEKFGENHGKCAALLGIVNCRDFRIIPSSLTRAFCALDEDEQEKVVRCLCFRIPIIQILLKAAAQGCVNGYEPMRQLGESTQQRRAFSVKVVLSELLKCEDAALKRRIENIKWEKK